MANITRWSPFPEMTAMQKAMDRFFGENWRPFFEEGGWNMNALALDMTEDDNAFTVTTELPGVQPENIQVKLDGDLLTIEGEIPEHVTEKKAERSLMKERRYGRFSRTVRLPQSVDESKVDATFDNGVLKLVLPKSEEAQPKRITVKTASAMQK